MPYFSKVSQQYLLNKDAFVGVSLRILTIFLRAAIL